MPDLLTIILSRIQFAFTIGYHFLFVPVTLGFTLFLAITETIYVKTGNPTYKNIVKFWGIFMGLQFAMGVATGVPMEFQFGTNWAYYSHYVGDIFGAPLAVEGMMAFFLEATFIGVFFFGWDKLSKIQHCIVTWLVFFGSNMSGLWILVANGWMQNPVGSFFNPNTMRMELNSFKDLLLNPEVQGRFLHTVSAGYITGAILVIGISSAYLLLKRNYEFAKKSIQIAGVVGIFAILFSIYAGDEQGQAIKDVQPAKFAAIEAIWEQDPAPAPFNLFAIPLQKEQRNILEIQIPKVLGIISTHSLNTPLLGVKDVIKNNEQRIRNGLIAYKALEEYKENNSKKAFEVLNKHSKDLGYALLLKKYRTDVTNATQQEIKKAAQGTVPNVFVLFFAFRIMVGVGLLMALYFIVINIATIKGWAYNRKWLLIWALIMIPMPWIAIYSGWFVAEYGRQPWVITNILPTFLAVSNLPSYAVATSLSGLVVIYFILLVINLYITIKVLKKGPEVNLDHNY